jgi:hypothetical protein
MIMKFIFNINYAMPAAGAWRVGKRWRDGSLVSWDVDGLAGERE